MIRYAASRAIHAFAVVLAVTTLTFVLIHAAPGDPLTGLRESAYASPEFITRAQRHMGLDRPLYVQYLVYLGNLFRGDLGESFATHIPVWHLLRPAIPNTLLLGAAALLVDFTVGMAVAAPQAIRPGGRLDRWLSNVTLAVYAVPVFWLGILLSMLFSQALGWLPIGDIRDPIIAAAGTTPQKVVDILRHLVLPAATLGLVGAASTARYQRTALFDALRQDFIRTAHAKGLTARVVLLRHALRNALLPTITLFGLSLPVLFSGAVLVESVFGWPGMGTLAVQSVMRRDYLVVTAAATITATAVVVGSALADLLYRVADPRTRSPA
ncbi:MAG: ABC transporter permease [Gemmatimonadetes bacterium]|nr:ABC transporter permease [Gemmatimonadota bacterium]